jgi:hypothetical protein
MVLSFVYLVFVSLLKLLLCGGRRVDVKDIDLLVLRHQWTFCVVRSSARSCDQ